MASETGVFWENKNPLNLVHQTCTESSRLLCFIASMSTCENSSAAKLWESVRDVFISILDVWITLPTLDLHIQLCSLNIEAVQLVFHICKDGVPGER